MCIMPAGNFTPLVGTDLNDILNENDAVGEWETGSDGTGSGTPRWLFPRFTPVCPVHHEQMNQSDEDGAEFSCVIADGSVCEETKTMDAADMYLSRSGIGPYDTDVETIAAWLSAPRNIIGAINLLGDPGTGKTALIEAATTYASRGLHTWLCTPDDTGDSLFMRFVGEGKGDELPTGERSPYTLGPLPYAAKHGLVLYLDEWMRLDEGVVPRLYSLADGRHYLPGGNVDGSALEIHPDFRLILSSNPMVRGASMPEPMASRCASTTITVETSGDMLRDLGIDESVVAAWEALGNQGLWRPAIRELKVADYWLTMDKGQSVSAFLPEHCPESQREQVRDIVVGFLGGNIRKDGRLVVS